jgi:hypothetical protein
MIIIIIDMVVEMVQAAGAAAAEFPVSRWH